MNVERVVAVSCRTNYNKWISDKSQRNVFLYCYHLQALKTYFLLETSLIDFGREKGVGKHLRFNSILNFGIIYAQKQLRWIPVWQMHWRDRNVIAASRPTTSFAYLPRLAFLFHKSNFSHLHISTKNCLYVLNIEEWSILFSI